jgi:putative transposase
MEDMEVGLRREAVRRRLAGESPEVIACELGRTRQWVRKWTARYDPDDPSWAQGRPHAARRVANRTEAGVEAQVLAVRARLEANPWAQVGAPAIAWELEKLGAVVPPLRTIERILRRAGTTGRPRPGRRASKGVAYPAPAAERPGDVVQIDLVGPRHLDGGVRFHALNQIDVCSHHAGIEIVADRADERVVAGLHALWTRHGVPGRVQFDNGGPFTSPTGVGEVVRFCLHQGTTPVFIPPREPWRNGTIEHFNDTFDKRFFRQERFSGRDQLAERASAFEAFHNRQHRYRATAGRAPDETVPGPRRDPLAIAEVPAGWPAAGRIEYIRFIRSDHKLRLLGRAIRVPDGHAYQYLTAALDLSIAEDTDNLLVCDEHGQLITSTRLASPAPHTPARRARRAAAAPPRPPGSPPRPPRDTPPARKQSAGGNNTQ